MQTLFCLNSEQRKLAWITKGPLEGGGQRNYILYPTTLFGLSEFNLITLMWQLLLATQMRCFFSPRHIYTQRK